MSSKAPGRLTELDALRGLAALAVVLFHYTWRAPFELPRVHPVPRGFFVGHFGVQLFFAISGFVILMTLERTRSAVDFIVSRIARLYPAYWAGIALTSLGVLALGAPELARSGKVIAVNITMLQAYFYVLPVDGVYWSLALELGFYFCMLTLWQVGLLPKIDTVLLAWLQLPFWVPRTPSRVSVMLVSAYIPWFAIGMAAYRVRTGARTWAQQAPILIGGLAAVAITAPPAETPVYLTVVAVCVALVKGWLAPLARPALMWLGRVSYSLYLTHQVLGYALMARLEQWGANPWLATGITLAAAMVLAEAVHRLAEVPGQEAIKVIWRGLQQLRPQVSAPVAQIR